MKTFLKVGFISLTCAPGFWGTDPYDGREQALDLKRKIDIHAVHSQAKKIGEALKAAHSEFPLMYPPEASLPLQVEEPSKLELLSLSPLVQALQQRDDQAKAESLSSAEEIISTSEGKVAVPSSSSQEEIVQSSQTSKSFHVQEKKKPVNREPIDVSLFFPEEDKIQDSAIDTSVSEPSEPLMDLSLLLSDEVQNDPIQSLPEGMLIDVSSLPSAEAESHESLTAESASKEMALELYEKEESRVSKSSGMDEGPMDIAWLFDEEEEEPLSEVSSSVDEIPDSEISEELKEVADRVVQDIVLFFDRQLVTPTKEGVIRKLFEQSAMVIEQLQVLADDLRIDIVFQEILDQLRVAYPFIDFEVCSSLRQARELWGSFMDGDLESAGLSVQVQERGLEEFSLSGDDSDFSENYPAPDLVSSPSSLSLNLNSESGLLHSRFSYNASTTSPDLVPVSSVSLEEETADVDAVHFSTLSERAWKDSETIQGNEPSFDFQSDERREVSRETSSVIDLSGGDELIEYLIYDEMRHKNEGERTGTEEDLSPVYQDVLPKSQTPKVGGSPQQFSKKNLPFDPKKRRVEPKLEDETVVEEVGLYVVLPDVENGLSSSDDAKPGRGGEGGGSDSNNAEGSSDQGETSYTEAPSDSSHAGASSKAQPGGNHNALGQATAPQHTEQGNQIQADSEGSEDREAIEVVSENSLSSSPMEVSNGVGFAFASAGKVPIPQELKTMAVPQAQQEALTESSQETARASSLEVEALKKAPTQGLKFVAVKIPQKAHYQSASQALPREEMPIKREQAMPDSLGLKAEVFPRVQEESLKKTVHQAAQTQGIDIVETSVPQSVYVQLTSQASPETRQEDLSETPREEATQASRLEKEAPQTMSSLGLRFERVTAPQQAHYVSQAQAQPKEEAPIKGSLKEADSQGLNFAVVKTKAQAETQLSTISTPTPQTSKSIVKGKEQSVSQVQRIDVPKTSLPEEADLTMDDSVRAAFEGKKIEELREALKVAFQKLQSHEEAVIADKPVPEVNSSPAKSEVNFGAR